MHSDGLKQASCTSSRMAYVDRIEQLSMRAVVLLAFMIPLSTAGSNALLVLLIASWIMLRFLRGDWHLEMHNLLSEPVTRAVLLLLAVFVVASFYAIAPWVDIQTSLGKIGKWIVLPILVLRIRQSTHSVWVLHAFLGSMMLTLFLALLKMYGGINVGPARFTQACVFKDHIFTNLMMSFAAFLLAHQTLKALQSWRRVGLGVLCVASIYYVLMMSEGRSGYVILSVLWVFFCLQTQAGKHRVLGIATLLLLLAMASFYSSTFQRRMLQVVNTVPVVKVVYSESDHSMHQRLSYLRHSFALIKARPLFGFGTGSFKTAYRQHLLSVSADPSEDEMTANPHNEYLNIAVQCGLLGLCVLLWFFYSVYKKAESLPNPEKHYTQGLIAIMIVGCMGNAWLMDFTSGCFFIVCLSACLATKPVERIPIPLAAGKQA